jgi:hypothetical protein
MIKIISGRAAALVLSLFTFGLGLASGQTSNTCTSPLNDGTYSKFSVIELAEYSQTNASGTVPFVSNSFAFEATIDLATNLSASAATLTLPGQTTATNMFMTGSGSFIVIALTNSFSNVTAAYPDGTYKFTISNTTTSVPLPAGSALPNAPTLSDYDAAQAIDPTKDFTLSWAPFTGGRTKDVITIVLTGSLGTVFKSDDFGCPGALNGTSTSILIPSNTLSSSQTYRAEIGFVKVGTLDTNSVHGDALLAGTEAFTIATVATASETTSAPVLTNTTRLSGGTIQFDLATTPGVTYTIQFNEDLNNSAGWSSLLTTDAVATSLTFTNTPPAGVNAGFYRAFHN